MLAAKELFASTPFVAVAALTRSDVLSMTKARREFKNRSIALKVIPNGLCAKALEDTDRAFLRGLFIGQTIVAYPLPPQADDAPREGEDASVLARRLLDSLGETPTMRLMGGALDNIPLYPEDFEPLAKLKSQHQLRADLAMALKAPLVRTATTLRAPALNVARTLAAPHRRVARALAARKTQLVAGASSGDEEVAPPPS